MSIKKCIKCLKNPKVFVKQKIRKRTLVTLLEKPFSLTQAQNSLTISNVLNFQGSGTQEGVSTKKEEKKNVNNILREAHLSPKPNFTYHFSFHFQIPEIWSSRKCFYKKKEKRTLVTFLKKFTYPTHIIHLPFPFQ